MKMRVQLKTLQPNPHRDFTVDPISDAAVAALKQSIKQDGFWGGAVVTKIDGEMFIACGHTRTRAAIESGIKEADLYVVPDMSDEQLIRIYARENSTQRGNNSSAIAGTVASALKYLARQAFGNSPENSGLFDGNSIRQGIGTSQILDFLGENVLKRSDIEQQLANLKSSGDYARILEEVQEEIEEEVGETLAELEEKVETAKRADVKAKAEEQIASVIKKQEKLAEIIEKNSERTFDLEGVSKHLNVTSHLTTFRELCEKHSKLLPVRSQAGLAKALVASAAKNSRNGEVTSRYISEAFIDQLTGAKRVQGQIDKEESDRLSRQSWNNRADSYQTHAAAGARMFNNNIFSLAELHKTKPKGVTLHLNTDLRNAVADVKETLARLAKIGIK
jgi:hypothetical protein